MKTLTLFLIASIGLAVIDPITDQDRLAVQAAELKAWQAEAEYWKAQAAATSLAIKAQMAVAEHQKRVDALQKKCGAQTLNRETLACEVPK